MKKLLHLFFDSGFESRKWYHVILWWEIRRIPYNIIMLFSSMISFFVLCFIVEGAGDFIHPMTPIIFGFLANFCYTFGWITEYIIRLFSHKTSFAFARIAFKAGLLFSILFVFAPNIICLIQGIIQGEKVSSPYSHFATDKPEFSEIVGEYQLDNASATYLEPNDRKLIGNIKIELNPDSTFTFENLPIFGPFDDYCIANGKGEWNIEKHSSFYSWALSMKFDPFEISKTGRRRFASRDLFPSVEKRNRGFITSYFIYNNKPPYAIYYIISDPDSWEGLKFNKTNWTSPP